MNITSLDFQQARIKQVLFKSRLRSVLYGVRESDASLFAIRQNPLGQWLYNIVKPKYSAFAEVREIEHVLQRMLDTGAELVRTYQRGQIEQARNGLGEIETYADHITRLLQQLEQRSIEAYSLDIQ